jgi:hypothetical protein
MISDLIESRTHPSAFRAMRTCRAVRPRRAVRARLRR